MILPHAAALTAQARQDRAIETLEFTVLYRESVERCGRPFAFWLWSCLRDWLAAAPPASDDPGALWAPVHRERPRDLLQDARTHRRAWGAQQRWP
jgi:hypothetical protein